MKKIIKALMLSFVLVALAVCAVACGGSETDNSSAGQTGVFIKKMGGIDTIYKYVAEDGEENVTLNLENVLGDDYENVRIKAGAFSGNNTIVNLEVPSSVTKIDEGAFSGMKALKSITLPFTGETKDAVNQKSTFAYVFGTSEYDGGSAVTVYYGAESSETRYMPLNLDTVSISAEGEYIVPAYAFNGCANLTNINISGQVSEILEGAFGGCKNLVNFTVPNTVTEIGKSAFSGCESLYDGFIPSDNLIIQIGDNAFEGAKLNDVKLLNSDVVIGKNAFKNSTVKTLSISKNVIVSDFAFDGCVKLTTVNLNNISGAKINQYAFKGCKKLTTFGAANKFDFNGFTTIENFAFTDIYKSATDVEVINYGTLNLDNVFGW